MRVAVAERRHQETATEVDLVDVEVLGTQSASALPQRLNHPVYHQQSVGGLARSGPDRPAAEDRRRHHRDTTRGSPQGNSAATANSGSRTHPVPRWLRIGGVEHMDAKGRSIAVIGSGVAGLTAA